MERGLSRDEKRDWLRLSRSENVGPITFYKLLERFGTAGRALEELPGLAKAGGLGKKIKIMPKGTCEHELLELDAMGGQIVCHPEPDYPPLLRQIEDAPPVLSVLGHHPLLRKKSVAIVGARNASLAGCNFARQLAEDLGKGGLMVVSGLARGVDRAAHEGALNSGTLGVQGGGVDVVYPRENHDIYQQMCARGCVIAEPCLGTRPQARHFPRRNRIISGLARAIIVIEASPRSGSLITARLALEQGRDVFAVPGSPTDGRAKGTNGLIREGAYLLESAEDVFRELQSLKSPPLKEDRPDYLSRSSPEEIDERELSSARKVIVESLSASAVFVDEVIRACQMSPDVVQTVLLELELAGRLERHPGNKVSILS